MVDESHAASSGHACGFSLSLTLLRILCIDWRPCLNFNAIRHVDGTFSLSAKRLLSSSQDARLEPKVLYDIVAHQKFALALGEKLGRRMCES